MHPSKQRILDSREIGKRLKKLRETRNLIQEDLAAEINWHPTSISKAENGERIPTVDRLTDYANFFDISVDYILYGLQDTQCDSQKIKADSIRNLLNEITKILNKIIAELGD